MAVFELFRTAELAGTAAATNTNTASTPAAAATPAAAPAVLTDALVQFPVPDDGAADGDR